MPIKIKRENLKPGDIITQIKDTSSSRWVAIYLKNGRYIGYRGTVTGVISDELVSDEYYLLGNMNSFFKAIQRRIKDL